MRLERVSAELLKLVNGDTPEVKERKRQAHNVEKREEIEVTLSEEARVELEAVSREKVEEIKKAIAEGGYEVNVHKISEAILKEILGE